jgi:hypothetical protein
LFGTCTAFYELPKPELKCSVNAVTGQLNSC